MSMPANAWYPSPRARAQSWCSYLGFEFATKQHTSCRAAPSNRSVPLLDYFEGTKHTGDIALGAASPLVIGASRGAGIGDDDWRCGRLSSW